MPFFGDPTGYGGLTVEEAQRAGFSLLGWARDLKGPLYKASYAMLISPDRSVFVVVGIGKVGHITLQATTLFTFASDGRAFYTTNNQAAVQLDLSRNWTSQLCLESSFDELLLQHRNWFQTTGMMACPFTSGGEYAEFRTFREAHFRAMESAGLIRYMDPSAERFQFTLSGAAKTAITGYFLGMVRSVSRGRVPRSL